ncbi:MAG: anion permease [Kocuria sp.]|nr:anion permease [Kocuria sp.]
MTTTVLALTALTLTVGYALASAFHDAPNATAIPVKHRALAPHTALILTAIFNALGVVIAATMMPLTWPSALPPSMADPNPTLGVIICALLATAGWNLLTWRWGLPSSSTAAFMGGALGGSVALGWLGLTVHNALDVKILRDLIVPVVLMPLLAFGIAWLFTAPVVRWLRHAETNHIRLLAHVGMVAGSTGTAVGHGVLHGQRVLWLLITIPAISGLTDTPVGTTPITWAVFVTATAFMIGSLFGAWRIARTVSSRLVSTDALRGGIAQSTSGLLLFLGALSNGTALSTTHTMVGAVLGAGTNQKHRSINHRQLRKTLVCWALTVPVSGVAAGTLALAISPLLGQ